MVIVELKCLQTYIIFLLFIFFEYITTTTSSFSLLSSLLLSFLLWPCLLLNFFEWKASDKKKEKKLNIRRWREAKQWVPPCVIEQRACARLSSTQRIMTWCWTIDNRARRRVRRERENLWGFSCMHALFIKKYIYIYKKRGNGEEEKDDEEERRCAQWILLG